MKEQQVRFSRALLLAYPIVLGGVVSAVLTLPIGIGGTFQFGAWLYVAAVIAVVTLVVDRLLQIPFERWASPGAFTLIPVIASAVGLCACWWSLNNTMGGPV